MADLRNSRYSVSARNAMLNALAARFANGYLRYYDGAQPADADVAVGGQTLLAELRFADPAFPAAAAAQLEANPLTPEDDALAESDATWFRCVESDGVTAIVDGSIGPDDDENIYNMELGTIHIVMHAGVQLSAFVVPMPAGGL